MTSDYEDLIQREIDGDLSSEEQAHLVAAASADPEVGVQREIMLSLGADLGSLAWCEPPVGLPARVMDEIGVEPRARSRPVPGRHRPRTWRPDRRQVIAFAAGVALMFALGRIAPHVGEPDFENGDAAGTLIRPSDGATDRGQFEADDSRAEAWTERRADRLTLHARGQVGAATPVRIEWNDQDWSVTSVRRVPSGDLEVDRGHARFVRQEAGPFTLELEFQLRRPGAETGDVRLRFEGSGDDDSSLGLGTSRELPGS